MSIAASFFASGTGIGLTYFDFNMRIRRKVRTYTLF
jgi:hypothetical protein